MTCAAAATSIHASVAASHDPSALSDADLVNAARSLGGLAGGEAALLTALLDANATADAISDAVGRQAGLAARVLKVANSAYYGQPRAVGSIVKAVQLLGTDAVRGIAAAACFDRLLVRNEQLARRAEELHRHSVAVACAAQALARLVRPDVAGDFFLAGLLHDLGVSVQMKLQPRGFAAAPLPVAAAERAAREELQFGASHERCSAVVFSAWALPAWFAAVARHHHRPDEAGDLAADAAVLALADLAAARAGYGLASDAVADIDATDAASVAALCAQAAIDATAWIAVADALPSSAGTLLASLA